MYNLLSIDLSFQQRLAGDALATQSPINFSPKREHALPCGDKIVAILRVIVVAEILQAEDINSSLKINLTKFLRKY